MGRITPRERTGLLVGVLAMFLALDVAFLVSLVGLPFTPFALGQAIIDVLPAWISIPLIELLHFWAKALLVIGVLALFLIAGGIAGMFAISPRRSDGAVMGAVAAPWIVAVILGQVFAGEKIDLGTSVVDSAVGLAVNALALMYLAPAAMARDMEPMHSRRRVLLGGAAVAAVAALGGLPLSRALPVAGARLGNLPSMARHLIQAVTLTPADPAIDALPAITPRITANEDHYTVDTTLVKPRVDIETWKLDIIGAVEAPFSLTYDELLDLDAIEQVHTLECISNPTGGELISTAVWTGVRMRDLLQRAKPMAKAFDVVLTSVDGYVDSFPIAKAMEPETLLVYLMNGKTLPQDHGYPVRTLVPNIYGMKNVKWLRSIEVVTFGPGLHMLRDDTSPVKARIEVIALSTPAISFKACGNTQENMNKAESKEIPLIPQAQVVNAFARQPVACRQLRRDENPTQKRDRQEDAVGIDGETADAKKLRVHILRAWILVLGTL